MELKDWIEIKKTEYEKIKKSSAEGYKSTCRMGFHYFKKQDIISFLEDLEERISLSTQEGLKILRDKIQELKHDKTIMQQM
jgi:hypothetical protein